MAATESEAELVATDLKSLVTSNVLIGACL